LTAQGEKFRRSKFSYFGERLVAILQKGFSLRQQLSLKTHDAKQERPEKSRLSLSIWIEYWKYVKLMRLDLSSKKFLLQSLLSLNDFAVS